jgi:hypothetical protein
MSGIRFSSNGAHYESDTETAQMPTKNRVSVRRAALLVALAFMGIMVTRTADSTEIWFDPHSGRGDPSDFMGMFRPGAPWQKAASAIKVFEISDELIYNGWVTEADLRQIFSFLTTRRIDLVVGIGALKGSDGSGRCGYNVEGYGLPSGLLHDAQRIKVLGGTVRFFGMDAPVYFGHVFDRDGSRVGCHLTIEEVARQVAGDLKLVRTVFPQVQFGDVEPLMGLDKETWITDLATWFDAYESATGEKLAFFRLDMAWDLRWQERIPALTKLLRQKGIPLQVIYNGDDNAKTDEAWIASAVAHFQEFEASKESAPDAALVQYWQTHPTRVLPETDPRTATWLINRYVQWQQTHR